MLNEKQQKVYDLLTKIPKGRVVTYKQISDKLKLKSPRLVGQILNKNIEPGKYPCHRVVKNDGTLAGGYAFGGDKAQKKKLVDENVRFNKNGKIDFKHSLFNFV